MLNLITILSELVQMLGKLSFQVVNNITACKGHGETLAGAFLGGVLWNEAKLACLFDEIDGAHPAALFCGRVAYVFDLVEDLEEVERGVEEIDDGGSCDGDL